MSDGSGNGYLGRGNLKCWQQYTDDDLRYFIHDWLESEFRDDFEGDIRDAIGELQYRLSKP